MHNQGSRRRSRRWKSSSAGLMVGWKKRDSLVAARYGSDTASCAGGGLSSARFFATTLSSSVRAVGACASFHTSAGRGGERSAGPSSSFFPFVFCHQVLSILFSISLHIHPFFFLFSNPSSLFLLFKFALSSPFPWPQL